MVGPLLHTRLFYSLAFGIFQASFALWALKRLGLALLSASLLAWGFVPNLWLLLVVLAPTALAAGVLNVALTSALTKASFREDMGGTLGIATSMQSPTGVVSPVLGGFLLERVGPWSLGLLAALLAAWLATFAARNIREAPTQEECLHLPLFRLCFFLNETPHPRQARAAHPGCAHSHHAGRDGRRYLAVGARIRRGHWGGSASSAPRPSA